MSSKPQSLTECYVAFLDLMGVRNLVKRASENAGMWDRLIAALQETKNTSTFCHETRKSETREETKWSLQVQAFSDCVVLFIPVETKRLSWLLASVRRLHDRLVRLQVPIRGGLTIGGMHWDQRWDNPQPDGAKSTPVAFGQGLIATYDLESATAVYPRILVSGALYTHIEELARNSADKTFPLAHSGRLTEYIRQDFDGLWHLDVLHPTIDRRDVIEIRTENDEEGQTVTKVIRDETIYRDWLGDVRSFIEEGCRAVNGERLAAKYMWLANYFNEKAQKEGLSPIRWLKNVVPEGSITLTCQQKKNGPDRSRSTP